MSNHRRRTVREQRRLRRVPDPDPTPGPDARLEAKDAAALVQAFLEQLPPRKRAVFELCEIEGMAGPEAAQALGVPVNTIYSRLHDARGRFKAFVAAGRQPREGRVR